MDVCFQWQKCPKIFKNMISARSDIGTSSVEFAVVAAFLFWFAVVAVGMLSLAYNAITLQFIATKVMRQAVVGPPDEESTGYSHAAAMEHALIVYSKKFGVELSGDQISICRRSNQHCSAANDDTGGGNELLVIRIERPVKVLFFGEYTISALALGRNEPFPSSGGRANVRS